MAITYVGGQVGGFIGQTTAQTITFALTGGSDSAPLAGDFVIIAYLIATQANDLALIIKNTSAVDYTLFGAEQVSLWADDTNLRVAYRVMPGTTETQFTVSEGAVGGDGSTTNAGAYAVYVFRGVNATPLDVAVQQGVAHSTKLVTFGSITPVTAGAFIFAVGAGCGDSGSVYTSSNLTAFLSFYSNATAQDGVIGAGYTAWTSGAFTPATFGGGTPDNSNGSYAWTIVALAPAAGGGATRPSKLIGLIGRQQPISQ